MFGCLSLQTLLLLRHTLMIDRLTRSTRYALHAAAAKVCLNVPPAARNATAWNATHKEMQSVLTVCFVATAYIR
jgi:hypothetical protein